MSKVGKQKMKLIRLRDILLEYSSEEHPLSANDLIEHLAGFGIEAERKSIYDDIEELRKYGMDIICKKGKNSGYFVGERDFEIAELKMLVDAVQATRFITNRQSRKLIEKLSSFAGKYDRAKLQRQVHMPERIKSKDSRIYILIDAIHNAINTNRMIRFRYTEWNCKKEKVHRHNGRYYKLSPWFLIWDDENYYLAAYDGDEEKIKHFRVDKMTDIEVTEDMREGEEAASQIDVESYPTAMFGMFGGQIETVMLQCNKSLVGAVIDRFGRDISICENEEGFTARVRAALSPRFYAWIMGFGKDMKIVSPPRAVEGFKKQLEDINSLYFQQKRQCCRRRLR